jgi:hypothetical protein
MEQLAAPFLAVLPTAVEQRAPCRNAKRFRIVVHTHKSQLSMALGPLRDDAQARHRSMSPSLVASRGVHGERGEPGRYIANLVKKVRLLLRTRLGPRHFVPACRSRQ